MTTEDISFYAQSQWFLPLFAILWLGITALLAMLSGWPSLAKRFPAIPSAVGKRLGFVSASIGPLAWFPVSYSRCLFLTVGPAGVAVSILFPFRLLSPPFWLPWSAVASVTERSSFFGRSVVVRLRDSPVRLSFRGGAGRSVLAAYSAARRSNAP